MELSSVFLLNDSNPFTKNRELGHAVSPLNGPEIARQRQHSLPFQALTQDQ